MTNLTFEYAGVLEYLWTRNVPSRLMSLHAFCSCYLVSFHVVYLHIRPSKHIIRFTAIHSVSCTYVANSIQLQCSCCYHSSAPLLNTIGWLIYGCPFFPLPKFSLAVFPRLHRCCLFLWRIFSLPNFPVALSSVAQFSGCRSVVFFPLPFLPLTPCVSDACTLPVSMWSM